jgi:light-harvesting complex 1 beta chain
MQMNNAMAESTLQKRLKQDSTTYSGIFAVSFVVFFVFALFAQLLTWQWRSWLPGAEEQKSFIGGVKAAVYTLMSHLT